jgi:hypothetical protein
LGVEELEAFACVGDGSDGVVEDVKARPGEFESGGASSARALSFGTGSEEVVDAVQAVFRGGDFAVDGTEAVEVGRGVLGAGGDGSAGAAGEVGTEGSQLELAGAKVASEGVGVFARGVGAGT